MCSFLSAAIFVHLLEEKLLREPSIIKVVEDMLKLDPELAAEGEAEAKDPIQSLYELEHDSKQQDLATESNTFPREETWTADLTSREQFSDSGYASMPHGFIRKSEFSQKEAITEESYNIVAETESNNNALEDFAATDQADDRTADTDDKTADVDDKTDIDDRTEYSAATSLGDSRIEGLVSQLADQLIAEVFLNNEQSIKTVFSTLQDLLKNFALKIGFNAQSQIQRDIMYYTHKYSR